ncbi:integrin alpha-IIb [Lampris incognitus]|uniref:integrin alpha-IIb n=1 Tax=Lampris incognitus TaxID=2546036 RepID=UPI0024B4AD5C|nr:integrin alpha-IIb [Lampris incognitus]
MAVLRCVLVLCVVSGCVCLNLLVDRAAVYSGPPGSLFGFSADFHFINKTAYIVIGAPRANTSQPGVREGGGVFLCPWSPSGGACEIISFDTEGDQVYRTAGMVFQASKSHQWFGASVRSVANTHLLACAPLYHWNVRRGGAESGNTPVGNCLLLDHVTQGTASFSPCRGAMVEPDYKHLKYRNDQRYCEVGFSCDITKEGKLVLGAPGGFFFQGEVITVGVNDVIDSGRSQDPIAYVSGVSLSAERGGYDHYHGYSVASGNLNGDSVTDYLVGAPNDRNTAGSVKIFDGTSGTLRITHTFLGGQVASYFGHSVAVTDINSDGLDDVLVGAPLFMDRVKGQLQERGQVVIYLQRRHAPFASRPDQSLTGPSLYGRFGSALAALGDLDMDSYQDVAVGAPWAGENGRGQVLVYLGNSDGLSATPSQVIDSLFPSSRAAFGFTLRGGVDIDGNGYPDLLVGAWGADQAVVYRAQAVIRSRVYLSLFPDFLNPDIKLCQSDRTPVSCFVVQVCVDVFGHSIPQEIVLGAELHLDRMKQSMARRTLLLSTKQPQEKFNMTIQRDVGVACVNKTAYLRSEEEFRDKLSPIFITLHISLLDDTKDALLYGHTQAAGQTRIILDCGEDNVCVPDLQLKAVAASDRVVVGGEQSVLLNVTAENLGDGAYETELLIHPPRHTHYQSTADHPGLSRLVCVQRKENQTVVIICDLGNPMRQGQTIHAGLFFTVGHLEDVESHISFNLRMRSKNSVNPDSKEATVRIQVMAEATLEIRGGSSPPEVLLPIPDWQPAVNSGNLEVVGPLVEHVYELRNLGPSTVSARLRVDFPSTQRGHILFYVSSNASEDSLTCDHPPNPHISAYQENSSVAVAPGSSQQVETNPQSQSRDTIHVNCSVAEVECVRFECQVKSLERGISAVVRISARLWIHTFTQTPYQNYDLMSSATYDVINASSKVQPRQLSSGHTQTQTSVLWRGPDGEREVPIGYVVLSVISGLLLLCLLCFVFWKLGFFKRNRPPIDDDDDDDDDEEQLAEECKHAEMK